MMTKHGALVFTKGFLLGLADRLDGWAGQSQASGWSTHQVAANREAADDCRRVAANIATALREDADASQTS